MTDETIIENNDVETDEIIETGLEQTFADAVSEIFTGSAADSIWQLKSWQIPDAGSQAGKECYLFTVSGGEYADLMDKIRDEYGSGRYRIRLYQSKRGQKMQLFRNFELNVRAPASAIPKANVPQENSLADIVRLIQDDNRQTREMFQRIMSTRQPEKEQDPLNLMRNMVEIFKPMMPRQSENGGGVETFLKAVALVKELKSEDKETSVLDMIGTALSSPVVEKLLTNAAMPQSPQRRSIIPAEQTEPQKNTAEPQNESEAQASVFVRTMKQQIAFLIGRAQAQSDPTLYADVLIDSLPQDYIDYIVSTPNILNIMEGLDPRVASFRGWFSECLGAIVDGAKQQVEPRPDADAGTEANSEAEGGAS